MSSEYLGESFDIHGGGEDLIFPHHENEIAQSEGAFEKTFAKYWVHNGFVNINQEKMSKSLGNFLMIKDILELYHPEVIRLFLLSKHYRSPVDYSDKAMDEARTSLDKIYGLLLRIENILKNDSTQKSHLSGDYWKRFCAAMDDDFNTARGIGILFDAVRHLNRLLDEEKNLPLEIKQAIITGRNDILKMGSILGIFYEAPALYFEKMQARAIHAQSIDPEMVEEMINRRYEARKAKDWKKADHIRQQLSDMNITLEDRPEGTVWKIES